VLGGRTRRSEEQSSFPLSQQLGSRDSSQEIAGDERPPSGDRISKRRKASGFFGDARPFAGQCARRRLGQFVDGETVPFRSQCPLARGWRHADARHAEEEGSAPRFLAPRIADPHVLPAREITCRLVDDSDSGRESKTPRGSSAHEVCSCVVYELQKSVSSAWLREARLMSIARKRRIERTMSTASERGPSVRSDSHSRLGVGERIVREGA